MFSRILTSVFLFVPSLLSAVAGASTCNGYSELCDRRYSNITFIGTHNSAFVGSLITENQHLTVTEQLDLGVRYLQAQTHKNLLGVLSMCHSSCLELDAGTLKSYLKTIKSWLDDNPNEVLTLLLTNGDYVNVSKFAAVFEAVGLDDYCFVPSTSPSKLSMSAWPTLQTLIDDGTRLIVFLDYDANESSVPYILTEFNYYFETPYDTTDADFPQCSIDRPSGASASGRMYIVNHYLDIDILGIYIPDEDAAETTNSVSSILSQTSICTGLYDRNPNVILVDYVDEGDALTAAEELNGLS